MPCLKITKIPNHISWTIETIRLLILFCRPNVSSVLCPQTTWWLILLEWHKDWEVGKIQIQVCFDPQYTDVFWDLGLLSPTKKMPRALKSNNKWRATVVAIVRILDRKHTVLHKEHFPNRQLIHCASDGHTLLSSILIKNTWIEKQQYIQLSDYEPKTFETVLQVRN